MNNNPYTTLPLESFWKRAISEKNALDINNLWKPKFQIRKSHKIVTFGSCFAQHIGRALLSRGYNWYIPEQPPIGISSELKREYNYDIFSARTGNIYTVSQLKQWVNWSLGVESVPTETWISKNGLYIDPFRPTVEPNGFESECELVNSRNHTLSKFRECIENSDIFIFTFGLTEGWRNLKYGYSYASCPGTSAGVFDPSAHVFHQESYEEIKKDFLDVIKTVKSHNKKIRFLLTVSPVPLIATYTEKHVLVATSGSKSILRAVCESFSKSRNIDYFPSFEIINSPVFSGMFFDPNKRTVSPSGVQHVMTQFFNSLKTEKNTTNLLNDEKNSSNFIDPVCEEEILEAFSK